jgi:hypothetical protein
MACISTQGISTISTRWMENGKREENSRESLKMIMYYYLKLVEKGEFA